MKIYLEVENSSLKALKYSENLQKKCNNNIIFGYYHLQILKNLGYNTQANIFYNRLVNNIENNKSLVENQKIHLKTIVSKLIKQKK
jgi:hypothetical protein